MRKCILKQDPSKTFAVKIMRVPDIEYFNIALKEFNLLDEYLSHPNVIKAHDMYYNSIQEKIFMVLDYPGEG